jgi:hypothetical protein
MLKKVEERPDVYVITGASGFIGGSLVHFLLSKKRKQDVVKICLRDVKQRVDHLAGSILWMLLYAIFSIYYLFNVTLFYFLVYFIF